MARPRYAEMLVDRRRQLGLSITQASQVLRLKEQVLIAFEEGDFDRIPKSGYAQGMLSSYARYLGLNSREVVDQFSKDLYDYADERRRELRLEGTGAFRAFPGTDAGPYVESRGLLPTSGGLAGDMGAFSTTSQPHSRSQATPLVGSRRYVGTAGRSTESAVDGALGDYGQDRPYTMRQPASSRARSSQARAYARGNDTVTRRSYSRDAYERDQVTTRYAAESDYADDLRYDEGYDTFDTISGEDAAINPLRSAAGSRSQRTRRRSNGQRKTQAPSRQGGLVGTALNFLSDPSHLIPLVVVLLAVLLTGIIIFSVRSCTSTEQTTEDKTVPITSTETNEETTDKDKKDTTTDADSKTDTETAKTDEDAAKTDTKTTTEVKETKVIVSVESGMVSWLDIQCDGESKVADTITGPWSQTYTVHDTIIIEAGDTTAVTVTENGVRRQFETKTSGLGSITIQGTPEAEDKTSSDTKTDEGTTSSDTTSENAEGSDTQSTDTQESQSQESTTDTSEDEYLYEYNGYDIYYNAENDLYYFFDESGAKHNAANGEVIG